MNRQVPANVWRIVDASLNRAAEGLRVCEDYVRFAWDDVFLCAQLKDLRHALAQLAQQLPRTALHASRDTVGDVGTRVTVEDERQRSDAWHACQASFERTKQAFRSLEEFGKAISAS
ncbi:MAG: thiamine phosphate synthase, partial [Planctomycetales bacterium]|nr:thiamine phosphate synthase [Planctomycetales bacterium]